MKMEQREPIEVESTVIAETPVEPQQLKIEDQPLEVQAAYYLRGALPKFRHDLDNVTGSQAKRILAKLIESPLEDTVPSFTTKEAHALYNLGIQITNSKFILFQVSLKDKNLADKVEEAAKEAGAKASEEATNGQNEIKGELNGG